MPGWNDFSGIVNTLRELDVSAIEDESVRPLVIACVGDQLSCATVATMLRTGPAGRFGPSGSDPLIFATLQDPNLVETLRRANLIVIALDGREPPAGQARAALSRVFSLLTPQLVALLNSAVADPAATLPAYMRVVPMPSPYAPEAHLALAEAVVERLPRELVLSAARRLPGLRPALATQLTQNTANANASYALASSLPQQIPLLSLPFAAADMLVLTKNQALMVYRLALAHGAPADFQAHLREIVPVIGGAYLWRQLARTLIGLIPGWGIVPKISIAYGGTYTTGVVATRWYATGDLIRGEQLRQLAAEGLAHARVVAAELVASARAQGAAAGHRAGNLLQRARKALPSRRQKIED